MLTPNRCALLTLVTLTALMSVSAQHLTLTPLSGAGGMYITATSSGFDSENVGYNTGFYIENSFRARCPPATEEHANCSVTLQVPYGPPGTYTFTAFNSIGETWSETFTVLPPKLDINPTCGPPGTQVTLKGTNFPLDFDTQIFFDGESMVHTQADASGNLSATIEVPSVTEGQHTISAIANLGTNASQRFTVKPCDEVARLTDVRGTVETSSDGIHFTPAHVGDPVHLSDSIRTGSDGQATILFNDYTTFNIGIRSVLEINQYLYDPSTHDGYAFFNFVRGIFIYASGLINKKDPPNVNVGLEFGSIGIRGTEYICQHDPIAGTVEVDLIHGSIDISPNQTVNTTVYDAPIKIVFNGTGATTAPLTQQEYDEIKARLFPPTSTDTTPPQVNVFFAIPPGAQGGFFKAGQTPVPGTASASDSSNVISISCTDNLTGLTAGTITGNGTADASLDLSLMGDGIHIVSCSATDGLNNQGAAASSNRTATVKIDTTAPSVIYSGNLGNYTVDQNVQITCSASDVLSGIANSHCTNISGPAYSFNVGPNSFTASATDNAANVSTVSTSFTVVVTYDGLINLVTRFEAKATVAAKMIETLKGAKAASASGNTSSANNQLNAFINQVQAQAGKSLTTAQANILISLATALKR